VGEGVMITYTGALSNLEAINAAFTKPPLRPLNALVLSDPRFYLSPGGSEHHHNYKHGLVIHVHEVMSNVLSMTDASPSEELVTAVIWHDYMKVRDYSLGENGEVVKNIYRKFINHVTGSAMEFHRCAFGLIKTEQLECIEHLMLSHHGRKEWGSPVEPLTAEAFILHAADMMSAKGNNL
jgi:3'-5' exoribonuclease